MALAENLNRAIQNGDKDMVQKLVQGGAAMDHLLGMRGTALCAALSARQSSIALYLIEAGCGVNVEDYDREPPLYLAISKECFDVVKKLVRHPKCQLNKSDPLTLTPPLCLAAYCGFQDVVSWFIEAGADLNVKRGIDNCTPLHCAIMSKNYKIMDILIKADCDLFVYDNNGFLPVHTAARYNDVTVLRSIISKWIVLKDDFEDRNERKVNIPSERARNNVLTMINFKSKVQNRTPLDVALLNSHIHFATLLLKCGATPNTKDDCNRATPLCVACCHFCRGDSDLDFVQWLLEAGACVNDSSVGHRLTLDETGHRDMREETPIMIASKENNLDLINLLMKYKAEMNRQNIVRGPAAGQTPLTYSLNNAALDAAKYFLDQASDADIASNMAEIFKSMMSIKSDELRDICDSLFVKGCKLDTQDFCPMNEAIFNHNTNLVSALIRNGVSVNTSNTGVPPMHACAEAGDVGIAQLLLSSGANINVKNDNGVTPLTTALDYSDDAHIQLCYFLVESLADIPGDLITCMDDLVYDDIFAPIPYDSEDDDSDTSDDASLPDAFAEAPDLLITCRKLVFTPRPLFQQSIQCIRKYFVENEISYSVLSSLPIPKKFQNVIAYK
ncbi:hypothetical protein FSP39_007627 [Pinctada imbricata]|uniref:Uncharacterized protein n=1 Tax=Pinctada imbricata TaxID=66713 RepID=A0AA88Y7N6_PINIB|nr:hypothetical protein FSP39_007627 [Pinctada imbricata]